MKNTNKSSWQYFSVDCELLNRDSLRIGLGHFWKAVMSKLEDEQVVLVFLKVRFTDNNFASVSHMQSVNKNMFNSLLKTLNKYLDYNSDNYSDKTVCKLIFQYSVVNVETSKKIKTKLSLPKKIPSFRFAGKNLPQTTDLNYWGAVNELSDNLFRVKNKTRTYRVTRFEDKQIVDVMLDEKVLFTFTDIFGDNPTSFTRQLKNQEYLFVDGETIVKKIVRKTDFITKIKPAKEISNKFITFDIETIDNDNIKVPYCVSIYDGSNFKSFYLSSFKNSEEMLVASIEYLLKRSYNGYKVYIHNLSHFDGIFLFRILSNYRNCTFYPVLKDGKMISLRLSWKPSPSSLKVYSIEFKDSYLMLPISLKKLAKAFNVEDKGIFPYKFVSNLDYIGDVPKFEFFDKISVEEYDIYKANFNNWSLKQETIKYCELDCKVLWDVINIFNENIFNQYTLNVHKFPTLPSLAFAIFRCHYLTENQIPKIYGQMYQDIRKGYTGGHTDVYIPFGEDVGCYDVNSLYPSSMNKFNMPVGKITFFEGDILKNISNPFGFFEVEVTTPAIMDRPLLQTKVKTKSGLRTVAPLGQWTDMVLSEEMKEYMKYGYQFKVLRGYLFEQANVFEGYVQDLYRIKQSETIGSPMYLISKLLMNSLYGRFGMNPYLDENSVIDNSMLDEFLTKNNSDIIDCLDLNNGKTLITYNSSDELDESDANVNISIAASITAYARIQMSPILADPNLKILYTDTDSAYVEGELDPSLVGKELGQFKLEYRFKECVFLAPKVYGGILDNGKELTKVKGFKNPVSYPDLKSLLDKNSKLELNQNKWFKSISAGSITVRNSLYTLVATENKRQLVYDNNNKIIGTKPFVIDNNKVIK